MLDKIKKYTIYVLNLCYVKGNECAGQTKYLIFSVWLRLLPLPGDALSQESVHNLVSHRQQKV